MYALVEIKGKQYKAEKGALLRIDNANLVKGSTMDFESVMVLRDEESVQVGSPYLPGVTVKTTVEDFGKGKKVMVYKYKRRKNYHRKRGHRQQFTLVRVDDIVTA